jgi:hypothetical protein
VQLISLSVRASEIFSGISLLSESQVINLHLTTLDLDFEGGLLKGDDNKIRKASFRKHSA